MQTLATIGQIAGYTGFGLACLALLVTLIVVFTVKIQPIEESEGLIDWDKMNSL